MARKVEAEMKKKRTSEKNRHSAEAEGVKGGEMHPVSFVTYHQSPKILLARFRLLSRYSRPRDEH